MGGGEKTQRGVSGGRDMKTFSERVLLPSTTKTCSESNLKREANKNALWGCGHRQGLSCHKCCRFFSSENTFYFRLCLPRI